MGSYEAAQQPCSPFERLPQELQDHIISLACKDDRPLIASIEHRIVYDETSQISINGIVHQYRKLPPVPALAHVSRKLRADSLSAFFGSNSFVFHLNGATPNLIWQWLDRYRVPKVDDIKQCIIQFSLSAYVSLDPGIIELRRTTASPMGVVAVKTPGALDSLCTCSVVKAIERVNEMVHQQSMFGNRLLDALTFVPSREFLEASERKVRSPIMCGRCEKQQILEWWQTEQAFEGIPGMVA